MESMCVVAYNEAMYILGSRLPNLPILSLQDGRVAGRVERALIDPGQLEVAAFILLEEKSGAEARVILPRDVRQMSVDGILINFADDIIEAAHVVRLASQLEHPYKLIGSKVVSDMQRRLGRVEDYTVNHETLRVQKIYVKRPVLRSPLGSSLVIDRTQILEVTDREIVVREATAIEPALATRTANNFIRKP